VKIDNLVAVRQEHAQGASSKVEVVSFGAGLVSPPASRKFQAQTVDDAAGDLVLDGKNIGQLPVILIRPDRRIVAHANQLSVDPQLLPGAQNRPFQNVFGVELLSSIAHVLRLAFKGERRGLGAYCEPINNGQVADDFAGKAVGEVVVRGI